MTSRSRYFMGVFRISIFLLLVHATLPEAINQGISYFEAWMFNNEPSSLATVGNITFFTFMFAGLTSSAAMVFGRQQRGYSLVVIAALIAMFMIAGSVNHSDSKEFTALYSTTSFLFLFGWPATDVIDLVCQNSNSLEEGEKCV